MVDKEKIRSIVSEIYNTLGGNTLEYIEGVDRSLVGARLFDEPLIGFGSADDPLFDKFKSAEVIGPWHKTPREWLVGAKSVISLFFPFNEQIRRGNLSGIGSVGSREWAYARIEGQQYICDFSARLAGAVYSLGGIPCVPCLDPRFESISAGKGISGYPEINEKTYGSSWSERHAAYVCGLGTFGLSKGLITERGVAGRFTSVITDFDIAPDTRRYNGIYDYCIRCEVCANRCPVNAIDLTSGKNHVICAVNVKKSGEIHAPRYGCGLCQIAVPCEAELPVKFLVKVALAD